jgi:hypothetical protein
MSKMRFAGTLLANQQRQHGGFPLADGKLHLVAEALVSDPLGMQYATWLDGWGRPLRYRADGGTYEVVSYGSDGIADVDYSYGPLHPGGLAPIVDAPNAATDLVLVDGRMVQRPFGNQQAAFETDNAINRIYAAAAAFWHDHGYYPGSSTTLSSVYGLQADLVPAYLPTLPTMDGWGNDLLYASRDGNFFLASFGADGVADHDFYDSLGCFPGGPGEGPSPDDGGDIVQACGRFAFWSRGLEP